MGKKYMATKGEKVRWEELRDWDWCLYVFDTIYKVDNEWERIPNV